MDKKQIIFAAVIAVLTLVIVTTLSLVLNPKMKLAPYAKIFPGITELKEMKLEEKPIELKTHKQALDKDQVIGNIYELEATNTFGKIVMEVYMDSKNVVLEVKYVLLDQSRKDPLLETRTKQLIGKELSILEIETVAGVTVSTSTVNSMINALKGYLLGSEDPYEDAFGKGYVKVEDSGFVSDGKVLSRELIFNGSVLVGQTYAGKSTGGGENSNEQGSITLKLVVDKDLKILFHELTHENHTPGFVEHKKAIEALYGKTLPQAAVSFVPTAGATNSGNLIKNIITNISNVAVILEVEKDTGFTTTEKVLEHYFVKQDEVIHLDLYLLLGKSKTDSNETELKEISMLVYVGKESKISGFSYITFEHTPGFYAMVKERIDGIVGKTITESIASLPVESGATNTTNLIKSFLVALKEVLANE